MEESMKNAIRYISEQLNDEPDYNKNKLIEEASKKFDLTPLQTEFLLNKYVLGI
jgi:transcription initiation factor IIF auxiliary subunit